MEEETRVGRYKEYRQSFIKEGAISLEDDNEERSIDVKSTTSTLPIGAVLGAVQEEEKKNANFENHTRRNRIIKIAIEVVAVVLIVAGLVVLGIFAWRK